MRFVVGPASESIGVLEAEAARIACGPIAIVGGLAVIKITDWMPDLESRLDFEEAYLQSN
jgi:hypothetical protein